MLVFVCWVVDGETNVEDNDTVTCGDVASTLVGKLEIDVLGIKSTDEAEIKAGVDSNSVDEIGPFVASLSVAKVVVSLSELVGSLIEVKVCTLDGLICLTLVEVTVEDLTDTK
jgi:hypothetical protein